MGYHLMPSTTPLHRTTTAPSMATVNNSGNADANYGSFSASTGSPPLILAFLAIGLFTSAMIAVFGYRGLHWGLVWAGVENGGVANGSGPRPNEIGERPKLWEVWATLKKAKVGGRWADIMPLSAYTVAGVEPPRTGSPQRTRVYVDTILQRVPTLLPSLLHQKKLTDEVETRLLVAVPILMPSPLWKADDDDSNVDERPVYSVGIVDVPWHKMEEG